MLCPYCKEPNTQVIDSRTSEEGTVIRRRRRCPHCNARFTTYEKAALTLPQVIKTGGFREPYSQEKLRRSMEVALRKRDVRSAQLDDAIERIEQNLRLRGEKEVASKLIGDLVMNELKELDNVAYVRYGSVYLNCDTLDDFIGLAEKARGRS